MLSQSINGLVCNGSVTLSFASENLLSHVLEGTRLERSDVPVDSSFANKNLSMLLQTAPRSGPVPFRLSLSQFKRMHRQFFVEEINRADNHQNTLLWYLTRAGHYHLVEELYRVVSADLNVNAKCGALGQTILHHTVQHGHLEDLRFLLQIGADPNLSDRTGRTTLHYLALFGNKHENSVDVAKLLLDHGSSLNVEDSRTETALHFAVLSQDYSLAEYFIQLSTTNVSIRNKKGYTALGYLCEQILNMTEGSLDDPEQDERVEQVVRLIQLILDRCPLDLWAWNFRVVINDQLHGNLFLRLRQKFNHPNLSSLLHRLESTIVSTDEDYRLFAERLLEKDSREAAILALRDTNGVNISKALVRYLAHDPHLPLAAAKSMSSDFSLVCIFVYYVLATDVHLLFDLTSTCEFIVNRKTGIELHTASVPLVENACPVFISNPNLHSTYATFVHTCLHFASAHVFSLKQLCRLYIRRHFYSQIISKVDRCSQLNQRQRDYLTLKEISLIYSSIQKLSSVIVLIERLYHTQQPEEFRHSRQALSSPSTEKSPVDLSSQRESVPYSWGSSYTTQFDHATQSEDVRPDRRGSVEELTVEPNTPQFLNDRLNSEYSSNPSIELSTLNVDSATEPQLSVSHEAFSIDLYDHQLAEMKAKSHDIEEMVNKFLSQG